MKKKEPPPKKEPVELLAPNQRITPDISIEHLKLIGRVIVASGRLEGAIQDTVWQFLRLTEAEGRVVTARNEMSGNVAMLDALGKLHLPAEIYEQKLKVTIKQIMGCCEDRNLIAHGVWATIKPGNLPVSASLRAKGNTADTVVSEHFPPERMRQIVRSAGQCTKDLLSIVNELCALRGTPPPKRTEC